MAGMLIGFLVKTATGSAVAGYIASYAVDALLSSQEEGPHTYGNRLSSTKIQSGTEGVAIKHLYGTSRVAGNIIWTSGIDETASTQSTGGGKGGGGGGGSHTSYTYSASFAIGLCEGPVGGVRRIWADGNLIYSKSGTAEELAISSEAGITFHLGSETQLADSTIEAREGVGNSPAHRGLAYVVFEDFQLEKYGNRIPSITCEVVAAGSMTAYERVSGPFDTVKAPGTWGQIRNCYGLSGNSVLFIDPIWNAAASTLTIRERAMDIEGNITEAGITFDHFVGRNSFFDKNGPPSYVPLGMRPGYYALPIAISKESGGWWQGTALYKAGNPNPIYESPITQDVHFGAGYPTTYWGYGSGYYWYHYLANNNVNAPVYKRVRVSSGVSEDYDAPNVIDPNSDVSASRMYCDDSYTYFTGLNIVDGGDTGRIFRYAIDGTTPLDFIKTPVSPGKLFLDYDNPGVIYFTYANALRYISFDDPVMRTVPQSASASYNRVRDVGPYFVNEYVFWSGDSMYHWASYNSSFYPGNWEMHSRYLQVDEVFLSEVVSDLCSEVGLETTNIDVSDLTSIEVKGYVRNNQMTARVALQPLLQAYSLSAVETDYKLKFELKHGVPDKSVVAEDLAAEQSSTTTPDKVKITRKQDTELPRRIEIRYPDFDGDYQDGNQFAQRIKT